LVKAAIKKVGNAGKTVIRGIRNLGKKKVQPILPQFSDNLDSLVNTGYYPTEAKKRSFIIIKGLFKVKFYDIIPSKVEAISEPGEDLEPQERLIKPDSILLSKYDSLSDSKNPVLYHNSKCNYIRTRRDKIVIDYSDDEVINDDDEEAETIAVVGEENQEDYSNNEYSEVTAGREGGEIGAEKAMEPPEDNNDTNEGFKKISNYVKDDIEIEKVANPSLESSSRKQGQQYDNDDGDSSVEDIK
jgi:hypothetical protein